MKEVFETVKSIIFYFVVIIICTIQISNIGLKRTKPIYFIIKLIKIHMLEVEGRFNGFVHFIRRKTMKLKFLTSREELIISILLSAV